jgi:light-regulated signal transduction histidine kinase (bacteriophytochrome)
MGRLSVLLIDDQPAELDLLEHVLKRSFPDVQVHALTDARLALGACQAQAFDCVIADFNMPNMDGLACARELRAHFSHLPIILSTGVGDEMLAADAMKNGATDYIPKAKVTPDSLHRTIYRAIQTVSQARIIQEQREELEHFAYALAHDFKQPIRQISTFSNMVIEALNDGRAADIEPYLIYLDTAASRLSNLVDVMSQYTLLRKQPEIGAVDLNTVLSNIRGSILPYLRDVGGQIIADPAPTILGHEALMEQVLQNLIVNGLKYNKSKNPTVSISFSVKKFHCLILVEDNGMGIEAEYLEEIFKPMMRLHSSSEYKGSGLGLTLARKAILMQGGSLWCESEVGVGSKFFIKTKRVECD